MHSKELVIFVFLMYLNLIESHAPWRKCPIHEKFVHCAKKMQPTCRTLQSSGNEVCGGHCICSTRWQVRNDEGKCIFFWECPNLCPKNSRLSFPVNQYQQLCFTYGITTEQLAKPPSIGCSCIKGYSWTPYFTECVLTENCRNYIDHSLIRFG